MGKYFQLSQALVFEVRGKHAERYLQARLTNDVRSCSADRAILAGALSAQGKTEAYMLLLRQTGDSFLLICDGGDEATISNSLLRFKVSEQLELLPRSEAYRLFHYMPDLNDMSSLPIQSLPEEDGITIRLDEGLAWTRNRCGTTGIDLLLSANSLHECASALLRQAQQIDLQEAELLRISAGIPAFPQDINDQHILLESGLLKAISFTKGCYTGQEVIARIDSRGKPPFLLRTLMSIGPVNINSDLDLFDSADHEFSRCLGRISSCAHDPQRARTYALVYLKNSVEGATTLKTRSGERFTQILKS
ncbi:MAG: hypothetical protein K1X79_00870 [Oligoflexia bacterium]|nr:hypothetical protein [Oligoflexia bacterium]